MVINAYSANVVECRERLARQARIGLDSLIQNWNNRNTGLGADIGSRPLSLPPAHSLGVDFANHKGFASMVSDLSDKKQELWRSQ
jgi:hypothetical protein